MSFPYDRIVSNWLSLDREKKRGRGGGERGGTHRYRKEYMVRTSDRKRAGSSSFRDDHSK